MFKNIFELLGDGEPALSSILICLGTGLVLGLLIAVVYRLQDRCSNSFMMSMLMLPALVAVVIYLVNGSLGVGIAVVGAFNLVRFRSVPGTSREICFIFFAMAVGLACGIGYIGFAAVFAIILCIIFAVLALTGVFKTNGALKELRITIPESLDYTNVFDDIFEKYLKKNSLDKIKTANLGSMYELTYTVEFKNADDIKPFIDEIRCRNGNLTIIVGRMPTSEEF